MNDSLEYRTALGPGLYNAVYAATIARSLLLKASDNDDGIALTSSFDVPFAHLPLASMADELRRAGAEIALRLDAALGGKPLDLRPTPFDADVLDVLVDGHFGPGAHRALLGLSEANAAHLAATRVLSPTARPWPGLSGMYRGLQVFSPADGMLLLEPNVGRHRVEIDVEAHREGGFVARVRFGVALRHDAVNLRVQFSDWS